VAHGLSSPLINETFEKCSILFKFKEDVNINRPDEIGTGIHTLSILRIKLKLHCVQNVEPDIPTMAGGKRRHFAKTQFVTLRSTDF